MATLVLCGLICLTGCGFESGGKGGKPSNTYVDGNESVSARLSPTAGYVKDQACQECHQALFDSYQEVGMARSFYSASDAEPIEDFENNHYYHPASDRHYEMTFVDGKYTQTRYQVDTGGNRYNQISVPVDAIIGSGNHIRSYIHRTPAGEMYQMPLAWYAKAKKWRMNPGYDLAEHSGFQRKITRECMFCHNAYPTDVPAGSDAHWYPFVFPESLPHGIGCQRCHGPGAKHIEVANRPDATPEQAAASIVNPAGLTPERQEDVCMQCHMQPSSKVLSELVRAERTEYSYRPGEPLHEYRAMLDYRDESEDERFEINHHSYRLRQSKCYTQSEQPLSCTHCHDPHKKTAAVERVAHYRAACLDCHSVADCAPAIEIESATEEISNAELDERTLADCAGCHMPERRTQDVIHATMTDHKIVAKVEPESERLARRREPPPASLDAEIFPYFPEDLTAERKNAMELYRAIAGAELGNQRAVVRLQSYVESKESGAALLPIAEYARSLQKNGDLQRELDTLVEAVRAHPDHVQANLEMGMALAAANMPEDALHYYQRALAIGPPLPETHLGIGMSMLSRNDIDAATIQFREAVRLRAYYPEALLNLGIALFASQQWSEAKDFLLRARAADPTFVEADFYLEKIPK